MNEATLQKITAELRDNLVGRKFGKIFAFGREKIAVDFRRDDGAYLLISISPSSPRLFLIKRTIKELNSLSDTPGNFSNVLRKRLTHATLTAIEKEPDERIVRFIFEAADDSGIEHEYSLVVQMTGRSSNLFLLDSNGLVVETMRETFGKGQNNGDIYTAPVRPEGAAYEPRPAFEKGDFKTLSESLDSFYAAKEEADSFRSLSESAKSLIRNDLKKLKRLKKKLAGDLKRHGEPEKWKRLGDLVNANIATAKRTGATTILIDYFDEDLPEIELEIDEHTSLSDAAEKYFRKYTKSRNARVEIERRLGEISADIEKLEAKMARLEESIKAKDLTAIEGYLPKKKKDAKKKDKKTVSNISKYARDYVSSDGLVILVGKRSKDNDHLTFKIARSLDIWLHAADYPGSHVVIRRQGKEDVPQQTLIEAARLAAFYSKARNETKAAVRYCERKFVNKPKGVAPGLVSLASSKTIMVEPGVPDFGKN